MTREELEFRISEYLDNTLSSADRAALEQRLATDPQARALLAEYQALENLLRQAPAVPEVDYDLLGERISRAVSAEQAASRSDVLFSFKWVRRAVGAAVAAAVVIAGSMWMQHGRNDHRVALVEVVGPEVAQVQPVEVVEIGPSPAVAERAPLGVQEAIVTPRQPLIIAGASRADWSAELLPY